MRHLVLPLVLATAIAGCSHPVETLAGELNGRAYSVRLHNDGPVTLASVRVTTGQDVPPLTIASLAPGATSGAAEVPILHEHPIVAATVNGRAALYQPVEGFAGFNAQVAPGSYVIRMRWVPEYQLVDTRVVRE